MEEYNDAKFNHIPGIEINDVGGNMVELWGTIITLGLAMTNRSRQQSRAMGYQLIK